MTFGDWLTKRMSDPKIDDADLALDVGVSGSTVGRWRKGEMLPDRVSVARLALRFKVSPTTIMRMTDDAALLDEVPNEEGQQAFAALLAHVPDLGDFVRVLWKLPSDRRAALMLIARSMLPPDETI